MKIAYVGKHGSGGNDDELIVADALYRLGYRISTLGEEEASRTLKRLEKRYDFVLCHKWQDIGTISSLDIPVFYWNFDLVTYQDPALERRNRLRAHWMGGMMEFCTFGFMSDGCWAKKYPSKCMHLPQGSDQRLLPQTLNPSPEKKILFTGISLGGGVGRVRFVEEMSRVYGEEFSHLKNVYKEDLAREIQNHKFVVCPDHPIYPDYCSNRVYVALGYGGFVLHPRCAYLEEEFRNGRDLVYYESMEHLHYLVRMYSEDPGEMLRIKTNGLNKVREKYTYYHRVATMMQVIKQKMGVES